MSKAINVRNVQVADVARTVKFKPLTRSQHVRITTKNKLPLVMVQVGTAFEVYPARLLKPGKHVVKGKTPAKAFARAVKSFWAH